jgi:FAD synthetase
MVRVVAFGTFDLLHYGHVRMLEKAKELGGEGAELIVVISRDTSAQKVKGHPPIFPEDQRLKLLKSLKVVNDAVLGYESDDWKDRLKIIEDLKPNIIVLGYDQPIDVNALQDELIKRGVKVEKVVRLEKYGESSFNSSSSIIDQIIQKFIHNSTSKEQRRKKKEGI